MINPYSVSNQIPEYASSHQNRGYSVVINNKTFDNDQYDSREGSDEDLKSIINALNELEFKVDDYKDLQKLDMLEIYKEYSEKNQSDCDCFLTVIMSHGNSCGIVCSDNKIVKIQDLIDLVNSNVSLKGKPKLFIINACRGTNHATVDSNRISNDDENDADVDNNTLSFLTGIDIDIDTSSKCVPIKSLQSDVFKYFSTVEGFVSHRNIIKGSWFIQALANVLLECGKSSSLSDIVIKVNSKVLEYSKEDEGTQKTLKQISNVDHTLCKQVYFRPKSTKASSSTGQVSTNSNSSSAINVSKLKYAELRHKINSSNDLEVLEPCREELHRRLKVYHAWKSKNKTQSGQNDHSSNSPQDERAPQSIIAGFDEQHFLKIPFARPSDQNRDEGDKKMGMWYSHFDGKWLARQMEIYEDRPAVLLLAGVDDMNMCELSLEETGLTQKRGAEMLEHEFETIWNKNEGVKYLNDHFGQISSKYVLEIMQRKL